MRVLPTKWRRKPAGVDTERNYVGVTLCMHPTPGGDSPTPTTDRRSVLSFVAAFALHGFCSPDLADFHDLYSSSSSSNFL